MLDELKKNSSGLLKEDRKDVSVEIQDLTCYWDKVSKPLLSGMQHWEKPLL